VSAQRALHDGPVARSVREALEGIVSHEKARIVLDVALMLDGRAHVPEEASHAIDFVYGPLRKALEVFVDDSAADALIERLDPILTMIGSHVRRRDDESGVQDARPRSLTPVERTELATVLVASHDRTGIQGIARVLFGRAFVRQVGNVFDLVSALEANRHGTPVIVVDCSLPAIDPAALTSMLPLHQDARVILWGATDIQRSRLEAAFPFVRTFLCVPGHTSHTDIAALVESIVGP
jgi:hypothetical protein